MVSASPGRNHTIDINYCYENCPKSLCAESKCSTVVLFRPTLFLFTILYGNKPPVMLVLVLVLVLKDSLRTKMQSLSWSLTTQSLSLSFLVLVLEQKSLVMSLFSVLFKSQFTETACAWCKLACYLFIY